MIRLLHKLFIPCILIGLTTSTVSAEQSDSTGTTITASTPRPIEEITVVGQKSLARLRLRIDEKEAEIYNFFNANNSSPRMDIICTKRRPTGTHLLKRECEPRFLKQLRVEKTRDGRMGIGAGYNQLDLVGWSAQDFENLQNEMLALIASSNDFSRQLATLVELTENYETHYKTIFGAR
ncbi:MAG: hypothetical protein ACKVIB_10365 [Pseudomonadales bacterium]